MVNVALCAVYTYGLALTLILHVIFLSIGIENEIDINEYNFMGYLYEQANTFYKNLNKLYVATAASVHYYCHRLRTIPESLYLLTIKALRSFQ